MDTGIESRLESLERATGVLPDVTVPNEILQLWDAICGIKTRLITIENRMDKFGNAIQTLSDEIVELDRNICVVIEQRKTDREQNEARLGPFDSIMRRKQSDALECRGCEQPLMEPGICGQCWRTENERS